MQIADRSWVVGVRRPDPGLDRAKYCIRIDGSDVRKQPQARIVKVLDFVQRTARRQPSTDDFTGNVVFVKVSEAPSERDQQALGAVDPRAR